MNGHQYGPAEWPDPWPKVTIFRDQSRGGDYEIDMPLELVQQRRQIGARAIEALADENESWEWQAPVGPGNASYANGYENGRRAVGADLRALLAASDRTFPPGRCDQ